MTDRVGQTWCQRGIIVLVVGGPNIATFNSNVILWRVVILHDAGEFDRITYKPGRLLQWSERPNDDLGFTSWESNTTMERLG